MGPGPPSLADAGHVLAVSVLATLQAALLYAAVSSSPAVVTPADLGERLHRPVTSTSRDTLPGGWVRLAAVRPQPTLLADTGSGDTEPLARTVGVRAVRLLAELSLVALHTHALPVLAVAVSRAVRDLALLVPHVTLLPLPAGPADTLPAPVLALAAAEQRTDALTAGLSVVSRVTPALAQHTVSPPVTPGTAASGQLLPAAGHQLHRVGGPVIVVERHEPVTLLQEHVLNSLDRALQENIDKFSNNRSVDDDIKRIRSNFAITVNFHSSIL